MVIQHKFCWYRITIEKHSMICYSDIISCLCNFECWLSNMNIIFDWFQLRILFKFFFRKNAEGILHLLRNNLKSLSLANIRLYTESDRDSLIRFILRLEELETLKLLYLTPRLYLNSFNDLFEKLQDQISVPLTKLRNLSFTIPQEQAGQTFKLKWFPNVMNLEVFYTVEKSFGNIHQLINAINLGRTEKNFNPAIITFKEYLLKKVSQYGESELNKYKTRSQEFRNKIVTQNQKYVAVRTLTVHEI